MSNASLSGRVECGPTERFCESLPENPVNSVLEEIGRQDTTLSNARPNTQRLGKIVRDQDSCGGGAITGLNHDDDFWRYTI
nr:unnamed protein product [Spirometra erinaceieuropaei]